MDKFMVAIENTAIATFRPHGYSKSHFFRRFLDLHQRQIITLPLLQYLTHYKPTINL